MNKAYAPVLVAIGLLSAASAQSQMAHTIRNAARLAAYEAKHQAGNHIAPVGVERGGIANDECAGAITMTVGADCTPTAATFTGATESQPASTCSGFTSSAANDLWFTFTATGDITVIEVTGGGDAAGGVDAVLEVFSGACGSLEQIGCVDATLRAETESYTLSTTPGTTYYYRAYYWIYTAGQTVDDFTTCVYTPTNIPANDLCTDADHQDLAMNSTVTFTGDNTGALNTEGLGAAQVWVSFTTTECANITVDYCGTVNFANGFTTLFSDCPPTAGNAAASFNFTDCTDGNASILWELLPAGTYYYPVLTEAGSEGPYTINVTSAPCPQPPSNDDCANAIALTPLPWCGPLNFSGAGATESLPAVTCGGATGNANDDIWFSFVATQTEMTIGATGASGSGASNVVYDAVVEAFDGCGGSSIGCADNTLSAESESLELAGLTVGNTYYFRVYHYYTPAADPAIVGVCVVEGAGVNIGISETTDYGAWGIFPNPNEGRFTLTYDGQPGMGIIDVFDAVGHKVYSMRTALSSNASYVLSLPKLASGPYTVRLTTEWESTSRRMILQ